METPSSHQLIAATTAVQNGLDFAASAVEDMANGTPDRQKFAALHLFASIEILVKSRLAREHWSLTVADADKASLEAFKKGELRSVGAAQGLKRLRGISSVKVDEQYILDVQEVEKLRNRVAHFALGGEPPEAVAATLGRGLQFLLWFLGTHMRPGALPVEDRAISGLLDEIAYRLGEIEDLVKARTDALRQTLAKINLVVTCPRCHQDAMGLSEDTVHCYFCLFSPPDGESAAEDYVADVLGESKYRTVKHGGEWPVYQCIRCISEALVHGVMVSGRPYIKWACFSCEFAAQESELGQCSACGGLTEDSLEGPEMCGDCFTYYMNRD